MEFKDLYQKYLAGGCTDEERAFVEDEIKKAQAVTDELFKSRSSVEFTSVTDEEVLSAQKKFVKKNTVRIVIISLVIAAALSAVTAAAVFGLAIHGAKTNMHYNAEESEAAVSEYIADYIQSHPNKRGKSADTDISYIYKDEQDLYIRFPLDRSYYIFEYEVLASGIEFEVEFNPKTGECIITDIDRD